MEPIWIELKRRLVNDHRLSAVFLGEASRDKISDAAQNYEPLLIRRHADAVSSLTERCLSFRREFRELEILAVKAQVDFDLFNVTSAIDEELDLKRLNQGLKEKEVLTNAAAAEAFGKGSNLESGFSVLSEGRLSELAEDISNTQEIEQLVKRRWNEIRAYQATYHSRYTDSGNAHNFGERAERLYVLLKEDIKEASSRALALREGLLQVYAWDSGMPPAFNDLVNDLNVVDDLVLWIRKVNRELELRSQSEQAFDLVIPLVQPWCNKNRSLISDKDFQTAISTDSQGWINIPFSLDINVFLGKQVRLKGIGLSFGNQFSLASSSGVDLIQTADSFVRLAARITTPAQHDSAKQKYHRPSIDLGNVSLHQGEQPLAFTEGVNVENIDPIGDWVIQLHPLVVWKDGQVHELRNGINSKPIRDLKLTCRAYIPSI